jgi:hypothetical protein
MRHVMEQLKVEIPIFENKKVFKVKFVDSSLKIETLEGFDCTFIKIVEVDGNSIEFPFSIKSENEKIELNIHFIENYGQKAENLIVTIANNEESIHSVVVSSFDYNETLKRKMYDENKEDTKKIKIK